MALRYLLDSHTLLWWLFDDEQLSIKVRKIIAEPSHHIYVSSISAWEIAVKNKLGLLNDCEEILENLPQYIRKERFEVLPISLEHALLAGSLSNKHQDPFDRMLIAQALIEKLPLLTTDRIFKDFEVETIW